MQKCSVIVLLSALLSANAMAEVNHSALIGIWQCGPYVMQSGEMTITTREQKTFLKGGGYSEIAVSSVAFPGGSQTTMSMRLDGRWALAGDVVTMNFDKATFLASSNPQYTNTMGQQQADRQMEKKNWAKHQIDIMGDRMLYTPLEAMYEAAEVVVNCINPVAGSGLQ